MRALLLAALIATPAYGQTCASAPEPLPRDAVRLEWVAVTQWEDGTAIPVPTRITYIVYELVGGEAVRRCTTTALTAGFTGLADGLHTWAVAAMTPLSEPPYIASAPSPTWSKTVEPAVTRRVPAAPTSLTGN